MTIEDCWKMYEQTLLDDDETGMLAAADALQDCDDEDSAQTLRWLIKQGQRIRKKKGRPSQMHAWGVNLPLPPFCIALGRHRAVRLQRSKYAPSLQSLVKYVTQYRKRGQEFFSPQ